MDIISSPPKWGGNAGYRAAFFWRGSQITSSQAAIQLLEVDCCGSSSGGTVAAKVVSNAGFDSTQGACPWSALLRRCAESEADVKKLPSRGGKRRIVRCQEQREGEKQRHVHAGRTLKP
eukprot:982254-Prorocentrum_minimum.AAC.1